MSNKQFNFPCQHTTTKRSNLTNFSSSKTSTQTHNRTQPFYAFSAKSINLSFPFASPSRAHYVCVQHVPLAVWPAAHGSIIVIAELERNRLPSKTTPSRYGRACPDPRTCSRAAHGVRDSAKAQNTHTEERKMQSSNDCNLFATERIARSVFVAHGKKLLPQLVRG